ncbi:17-beta-hydroxysteroid dehydrogenase type 2-like [Adelges cooleyi]|uniref:17-beta-hydroxysteroid dehydrogenase type 2-like n=1 Tax=Adelges cooleyi TaxID=133065 RepID=UPI0021804A5E|nr:17-beta-hydroxysteroid dehydrogenase type 2-like [Adelges cooleyi]
MDLRDPQSVRETANRIQDLVETQNYKLHAVVNNAARMLMAEYEWQTTRLITEQFRVNVLGPMELTSSLLPKVRCDRGRIINVLSHCALVPLPGIAVYGATKAAVQAWTCGSRAENGGVDWISFYPGSFYTHSSIMGGGGRRDGYYDEMSEALTDEQREHYGQYMRAYKEYLDMVDVAVPSQDEPVPNIDLYRFMDHALWSTRPKAEYRVPEPWRYRIYSTLAHVCSALGLHGWRDQLIRRFVCTPTFNSNRNKSA